MSRTTRHRTRRPTANSSTFRGTWTDSNGNYTLTGLTTGSYAITPTLYPNVFTASGFANPVTVGPNATGKNFTSALLPTITINVTDPIANEGASPGTGTIRLERTGDTTSALAVQIFNTNTGTATRNTDYTLTPAPTASTTSEGGSGTSQYDIPAGAIIPRHHRHAGERRHRGGHGVRGAEFCQHQRRLHPRRAGGRHRGDHR